MKTIKLEDNIIKVVYQTEPILINPRDVKIKIAYCSICGYDMMMYRGDAAPPRNGLLGHEASGIIVQKGKDVTNDLQVGDFVTIDVRTFCMTCEDCRKGNISFCTKKNYDSNLMTEYVISNQHQVHRLPKSLPLREGCLIEPITMGMHGIDKASLQYGNTVIILGGGSMGLLMLQIAQLHPIAQVVVGEPSEQKRALALKLGASAVLDPNDPDYFYNAMKITNDRGFDAVIEASGNRKSAKTAYNLLGRGGSLVYFAHYGMNYEFPFNLFNLYWKDASIHGVFPPPNYFPTAIGIAHRLDLASMITAVFPFEEAAEAFAAKNSGKHVKIVLDFTETRFKDRFDSSIRV